MTDYLLKEDGLYLLLETGDKIILQTGTSESVSFSLSPSLSPSASISLSPSLSQSVSISLSPSLSPSEGFSVYTKGDEPTLPDNNNDLKTLYTSEEETNILNRDSVMVGQTGTLQYMIHQFKNFVGETTFCNIEWQGQSTLAPSVTPVYLQIWNHLINLWETIDINSTAYVDTDFELKANIGDLTNYKNSSNIITCRVYQFAFESSASLSSSLSPSSSISFSPSPPDHGRYTYGDHHSYGDHLAYGGF
jgi:hypothetical protein